MAWVKLNRPLTNDERMRQLKIDRAASEKPRDDFSVFSMNDIFLESTNAAFQQPGLFSYGFVAVVIAGLLVLTGGIYCLTDTPPNVGSTELAFARLFMGLLTLFGLSVVLAGLWGLQKENFTWRRFPIRFNRHTRMVYAFRGAGSKGVIAVPWEKAFF
ncbi:MULTISPECIES: hypothetical protein [Paraburkholderia]|uniref:hypothetical protein n=1 Tax=Paraburkholderia TaxID=1822464 RepID=UPI000943606E|nr:hypothetical protein [Paraburkholderia fungorum]